jgi:hypothetical protein
MHLLIRPTFRPAPLVQRRFVISVITLQISPRSGAKRLLKGLHMITVQRPKEALGNKGSIVKKK